MAQKKTCTKEMKRICRWRSRSGGLRQTSWRLSRPWRCAAASSWWRRRRSGAWRRVSPPCSPSSSSGGTRLRTCPSSGHPLSCCASPLGRAFVLIQAWGNAFILHAHPVVPAPHLRPHDKTHDCCISVPAVSVCDSCLKHNISKRLDQANQLAVMLPVCMYKATALVLT